MKNAIGIEEEDQFKLPSPFEVDGGASTTVKSPPLPPQTAAAPPMPQPMAPKPAPVADPALLAAKSANRRPLPGMPADMTPETLKGYLDQKRSAIDKYSADKQYALEKGNLEGRRGLGMNVANAAATFADGVMQGVARAGNPGFARQISDRESGLDNEEASAFDRARTNTMAEVEAKQKVDYMDPTSTMSKTYQEAFSPIFAKMGYAPQSVMKMPAAQIANIATLGIQYEDAQSQQELKKAMLGIQGMTAKANIANQLSERKEKTEAGKLDAAKGLQGRPWYQKIVEGLIPPLRSSATEEMMKRLEADPKNTEAMEWVKSHADDPRAAKIMERLLSE